MESVRLRLEVKKVKNQLVDTVLLMSGSLKGYFAGGGKRR